MNLFLQIIIIPFLISINLDWIKEIEDNIKRIDKNAILKIEKTKKEENYDSETKIFEYQNLTKLQINYYFQIYIDATHTYYKNDRLIFAVFEKGIVPILYKSQRKPNEPLGILYEKLIYFKNKNNGIEKYKELLVYGNEDYQNLRLKLSNMKFENKEIGLSEYLSHEKKYVVLEKN